MKKILLLLLIFNVLQNTILSTNTNAQTCAATSDIFVEPHSDIDLTISWGYVDPINDYLVNLKINSTPILTDYYVYGTSLYVNLDDLTVAPLLDDDFIEIWVTTDCSTGTGTRYGNYIFRSALATVDPIYRQDVDDSCINSSCEMFSFQYFNDCSHTFAYRYYDRNEICICINNSATCNGLKNCIDNTQKFVTPQPNTCHSYKHSSTSIIAEPNIVTISPNPLNNNTTIQYELPTHSTVIFQLFDINGKKVSHIQTKQAPGKNILPIENLPLYPGTFYYSLQLGEQEYTGKLVY